MKRPQMRKNGVMTCRGTANRCGTKRSVTHHTHRSRVTGLYRTADT